MPPQRPPAPIRGPTAQETPAAPAPARRWRRGPGGRGGGDGGGAGRVDAIKPRGRKPAAPRGPTFLSLLHPPQQRRQLAAHSGIQDEAGAVDGMVQLADVELQAGERPALILEVLDDAVEEEGVGDEAVDEVVVVVDDVVPVEEVERAVGRVDDP